MEDIVILAKKIDDIKFVYRRRSVNDWVDKITKGSLFYCK